MLRTVEGGAELAGHPHAAVRQDQQSPGPHARQAQLRRRLTHLTRQREGQRCIAGIGRVTGFGQGQLEQIDGQHHTLA